MSLQDDIAWFNQNCAFIAKQYAGQFVLVQDMAVRGSYPSYSDAFDAGVTMFGTTPFLVKQAVEQDPVVEI